MQIKLLSLEHLDELLAFELRNRAWFERHIAPRPRGFYSRSGVRAHIQELLSESDAGLAFPGIIEEQGKIVGRVNAKREADTNALRLGYRIDRHCTGRGLASHAVGQLRECISGLFDCSLLIAFVSVENGASQRVLEKNGFRSIRLHPAYAMVEGRMLDCIEYELQL